MKAEKILKRIFALPCGIYTLGELTAAVCKYQIYTLRDRSRVGCAVQKFLNVVRGDKVLRRHGNKSYELASALAAAPLKAPAEKAEVFAGRLYALPVGRYSVDWLTRVYAQHEPPTDADRCAAGKTLRHLVGIERNGKRLQGIGHRHCREYELKAVLKSERWIGVDIGHSIDAAVMATTAARLGYKTDHYFPTLGPIARDWLQPRRHGERRVWNGTEWVRPPLVKDPNETLAAYSARVQPMLDPAQVSRPTVEGHGKFCLEHGWDGFGREPISWILYSAVADWSGKAPGPEDATAPVFCAKGGVAV